jgi:hypothetical protein
MSAATSAALFLLSSEPPCMCDQTLAVGLSHRSAPAVHDVMASIAARAARRATSKSSMSGATAATIALAARPACVAFFGEEKCFHTTWTASGRRKPSHEDDPPKGRDIVLSVIGLFSGLPICGQKFSFRVPCLPPWEAHPDRAKAQTEQRKLPTLV